VEPEVSADPIMSNNIALGVAVDGPPSGWVPFKVVGSAVCFDEDGNIVIWHFEDDLIQDWEALGLLEANLACRRDNIPVLYWSDDDEDDLD
jgi:hypothetical protein